MEVRRTLSSIGVLFLIWAQVTVMLYYTHVQSNTAQYFGAHWHSSYLPSLLYFALCNVGGAIFYPISARLNDFEMHPTKVTTCFRLCSRSIVAVWKYSF